jgi:ribosomal protein L32
MADIVEIMDDVEDMPKWMQEAFRTGRVYHTCVKRVAKLESQLNALKSNLSLWQCPECEHYSMKGHVCYQCNYDPTG